MLRRRELAPVLLVVHMVLLGGGVLPVPVFVPVSVLAENIVVQSLQRGGAPRFYVCIRGRTTHRLEHVANLTSHARWCWVLAILPLCARPDWSRGVLVVVMVWVVVLEVVIVLVLSLLLLLRLLHLRRRESAVLYGLRRGCVSWRSSLTDGVAYLLSTGESTIFAGGAGAGGVRQLIVVGPQTKPVHGACLRTHRLGSCFRR